MNHKLGLVLKADPPTCWNTRRTSGGCVGLLFAQTTQNRMIWMNEVMKMAVDGTSALLTSNRKTSFVIWILMWCVKWVIVIVEQSRHACRCPGGTPLCLFFFLHLAVSAITFREECNFVFNRVWSLHLTPRFFYFFGAYLMWFSKYFSHWYLTYLHVSSHSMWPIRVCGKDKDDTSCEGTEMWHI